MERHTFDKDYVTRLVKCDPATQLHFSRYFGDLLTIKLRARLRSTAAVEDLRQETLLRVLQCLRRDGLHQPERLGAFVSSVCNNVLFEHYRAGKRESPLPEDGTEFASNRPGPELMFATEERVKQVKKAIEHLSQKDRELLREVFLDERDKDDVCREQGVDRAYLRVLLHRAIQRLKEGVGKAAVAAS